MNSLNSEKMQRFPLSFFFSTFKEHEGGLMISFKLLSNDLHTQPIDNNNKLPFKPLN